MRYRTLFGAAAGAVGTVAFNIATYADIVIRGRAESQVPAKLAGALVQKAGIDLAPDDEAEADEVAQHRQTGLGALMGYVTGVGIGMAYGLVQPYIRDVPLVLTGIGVGTTAMAASDIPATLFGATDPTTWNTTSWVSDFGFHLAYGLTTVITYETFTHNV